ncbi:MAG: hypothetical protein AAF570_07800, partial [Bacteroidota bacterium]
MYAKCQQTGGPECASQSLTSTNSLAPPAFSLTSSPETPLERPSDSIPAYQPANLNLKSEPPKEPEMPTPEPGETPLGKIEHENGDKEDIFASFVEEGIWWFNGGTPLLSNLYPTAGPVPLSSLGKGQFKVSISKGQDKLGLSGGAAETTGKDLESVTVESKGASEKAGDVTLEIEHTPEGAAKTAVYSAAMEVRAPVQLDYIGVDHQANGNGFESKHSLRVLDNFGKPVPYMDVNENFTLEYVSASLGEPKYSVEECIERDMTYAAPLKATLRLIIWEQPEEDEEEVKKKKKKKKKSTPIEERVTQDIIEK